MRMVGGAHPTSTTGFYGNQKIVFDPRKELAWTEEEEHRLWVGEFGFPGEMLQATPGRALEREWLT